MADNSGINIPPWLVRVVVIIVVSVWAANFVLQATWENYDPPRGIDAIMLAVVGIIAGAVTTFGKKKKEDQDDD